MPLLVPRPDRWDLRGYQLDLDGLTGLWEGLGAVSDAPPGALSRRLTVHTAHAEPRDTTRVADVAGDEVTAFALTGWDRSSTTLAVDRQKGTASITFMGLAPVIFLEYLQPLLPPRHLRWKRRNPYRFDFDPLSRSERREIHRHRQTRFLGRATAVLAALAIVVAVLLAVLLRQ